jgi:hypothetical protein
LLLTAPAAGVEVFAEHPGRLPKLSANTTKIETTLMINFPFSLRVIGEKEDETLRTIPEGFA